MSNVASARVAPRSAWIVVAHCADGALRFEHPTKKAAKAQGAALRAAGVDAFVFSAIDAARWAK